MNFDKHEVDAMVYQLDFEEIKKYLWDFGSFKFIGSEEHPEDRESSSLKYYCANKYDYSFFEEREGEKKTVPLYFGDFIFYLETNFENAEYLLNLDEGVSYKIIEKDLKREDSEKRFILVNKKSEVIRNKKLIKEYSEVNDLLPVLTI